MQQGRIEEGLKILDNIIDNDTYNKELIIKLLEFHLSGNSKLEDFVTSFDESFSEPVGSALYLSLSMPELAKEVISFSKFNNAAFFYTFIQLFQTMMHKKILLQISPLYLEKLYLLTSPHNFPSSPQLIRMTRADNAIFDFEFNSQTFVYIMNQILGCLLQTRIQKDFDKAGPMHNELVKLMQIMQYIAERDEDTKGENHEQQV